MEIALSMPSRPDQYTSTDIIPTFKLFNIVQIIENLNTTSFKF